MGEVSLTSMFQVLLLAIGYVAHLDMPLPCGLPEGKAVSLLPPGNDTVVGVHGCLNSLSNPSLSVSERCCSATRTDFRYVS